MKVKRDLRHVYSGAGLGGLLLALFLHKHAEDIEVDIYESAQALSEVGAGVTVWPRVLGLIKHLELENELLQISGLSSAEGDSQTFHSPGTNQVI